MEYVDRVTFVLFFVVIAIGLGHTFWDTAETQHWLHSNDQHADIMSVAAKGWELGEVRKCKVAASLSRLEACSEGDTSSDGWRAFQVRWQGDKLPENVRCTRMQTYFQCEAVSQQKLEHVDLQKPIDPDTVNRLVVKYRDN
jgi:hypothetical protein